MHKMLENPDQTFKDTSKIICSTLVNKVFKDVQRKPSNRKENRPESNNDKPGNVFSHGGVLEEATHLLKANSNGRPGHLEEENLINMSLEEQSIASDPLTLSSLVPGSACASRVRCHRPVSQLAGGPGGSGDSEGKCGIPQPDVLQRKVLKSCLSKTERTDWDTLEQVSINVDRENYGDETGCTLESVTLQSQNTLSDSLMPPPPSSKVKKSRNTLKNVSHSQLSTINETADRFRYNDFHQHNDFHEDNNVQSNDRQRHNVLYRQNDFHQENELQQNIPQHHNLHQPNDPHLDANNSTLHHDSSVSGSHFVTLVGDQSESFYQVL